jgi:hypothetical protein
MGWAPLAKAKRRVELHTVGGRAEFESLRAGVETEPGDERGEASPGVPTPSTKVCSQVEIRWSDARR